MRSILAPTGEGERVPTRLRLGPADHGRSMTLAGFFAAGSVEGYQYELIAGRVSVTPWPELPEARVENWLTSRLHTYRQERPRVINYVSNKAYVLVPGGEPATFFGPVVAAYHGFPLSAPIRSLNWQDVSPVLVAQVLPGADPEVLSRKLDLYLRIPSVQEYWVLDTTRDDPERPYLRVHRRWRGKWRVLEFEPGTTYTTTLLPDFELLLDPRS